MESPPQRPTMFENLGLLNRIPIFAGDSTLPIDEFISQIEDVSSVAEWPPTKIVALARTSLRGDARNYVRTHPELKSTTNWQIFRTLLKDRFDPKPDSQTIEKAFSNCYQMKNENLVAYSSRLRTIGIQLHEPGANDVEQRAIDRIVDKRLLQQFTNGLLPSIQRDVMIHSPKTFDEAIERAKKIESINSYVYREDINTVNYNSQQNELLGSLNEIVTKFTAALEATQSQHQNHQTNFPRNSSRGFYNHRTQGNRRENFGHARNQDRNNVICFKCQFRGHYANQCPQIPPNSPKCDRCRRVGHSTDNCRTALPSTSSENRPLNSN